MSFWAVGISAAASIGGSMISANSTKKAQQGANAAAQSQADAQNQLMWDQYLMSRGINPGSLPGITGDYVNTVLPLGAQIGGAPAEQVILDQIFGRAGLNSASPEQYLNVGLIEGMLIDNPDILQEITSQQGWETENRSPAQWLHDHIKYTEGETGGGRFTNILKEYARRNISGEEKTGISQKVQEQVAQATQNAGQSKIELPPEVQALQDAALKAAGNVYNGNFLNTELDALKQVTDARTSLAEAGAARNTELRAGANNVLNTNLAGLDSILSTRNNAAQDILNTQLGGLDTVLGTRKTGAKSILDTQLSGLSTLLGTREQAAQDILNTKLTGLTNVLGSRKGAANSLLDTELSGLSNVRGVQETGANNIYGAELLGADTYENAVKQAVARTLEQNKAARAIRGFGGDSSTDALTRARTLASGYQQAGGARANAGINLQNLLAQVRSAEATGQLDARSRATNSLGQADIMDALSRLDANTGFATTRGSARENDAIGRLNANTGFATSIGAANEQDSLARLQANTGFATTRGASAENDALARLQANLTNANSLAGILDSDVASAIAQASLQNAGDRAGVIGADISRQLGGLNLGAGIYGNTLSLTNQQAGAEYADINALLNSLGFIRQNQPQAPTPVQPNIQPTIGNGQIIGGALGSLGSSIGSFINTQNMIKAINGNNSFAGLTKTNNQWNGVGTNYTGMMG